MQNELLPANADLLLRKEWHLYDTLWRDPRRVEDFSLHCSLSGTGEEKVRSGRRILLQFFLELRTTLTFVCTILKHVLTFLFSVLDG